MLHPGSHCHDLSCHGDLREIGGGGSVYAVAWESDVKSSIAMDENRPFICGNYLFFLADTLVFCRSNHNGRDFRALGW